MSEREEEESSHESPSSINQPLLDQIKKMLTEELDRRDQIREGKRKESKDPIRISDNERAKDPATSRKKPIDERAKEYYSSGHSSQSSRQRSRRSRGEPDRMVENLGGYKMKIPPFYGKNDPDAYLDWEKKCEFTFNLHNMADINRVKLAVTEFYDYALSWWEQIVTERARSGGFEITRWLEMTQIMRHRFVPSHYQRELHFKLRRLSQGSRTVEEYYQEMEVMKLRANVTEDKEATMSRFLGGLNREIHDVVEMQNCVDLEEMLHKATLAEQQLKRRASTRFSTDQRRPSFSRDTKPFSPKPEPKPSVTNPDKSHSDRNPSTRTRELKCFRCQGYGHYATDCRNKKVMIIRDNGEVESEEEPEPEKEAEPEEYEAAPVMGKLLVARRILSTQLRSEKDEQRENLFHSRCLVQDKVCSLIIDGGSCTNVASETMVEKLGLPTKKHPRPYQLQWLNETGEMSVKIRSSFHYLSATTKMQSSVIFYLWMPVISS